jgi:hypothetical protein
MEKPSTLKISETRRHEIDADRADLLGIVSSQKNTWLNVVA